MLAGESRGEDELIGILSDSTRPLKARREAGRALAKRNSPEARGAIKAALETGPPYLRAAIAEGLGASPLPEAREWLHDLLNDPEEITARGAVRGWAAVGGEEGVRVLSDVLSGSQWPESVRSEAALSLGEVRDEAGGYTALTNAAWQTRDEQLASDVLEGLGRRRVAETQDFFREYLSAAGTPSALRVAAVEALGQAEGDSSALLLTYLRDADPEVRAGAAWAMSATEESGTAGAELLALLREEQAPEVRRRLYQAVGNQTAVDVNTVVALLASESQTEVRLAGFGVVARTCRESPNPQLTAYFDQTAVPELRTTALTSGDQELTLAAIAALESARTPAARAALEEIARVGNPPGVPGSSGGR